MQQSQTGKLISVTKQELINLLQHPEQASGYSIDQVENLINEYPYFQALPVLLAKISSDTNAPDKQKYIGKAAIHTADRANLKRILESSGSIDTPPAIKKETPSIKKEAPKTFENQETPKVDQQEVKIEYSSTETNETSEALFKEVLENLNTLHDLRKKYEFLEEQSEKEENQVASKTTTKQKPIAKKNTSSTSKKTTKNKTIKSKSSPKEDLTEDNDTAQTSESNLQNPKIDLDEQNMIIESFIKKETEISRKKPASELTNKEDLSVKSTEITEDLVSENLAEIFVEQGKTARAIEIYKKLIWKFPQKKSYFASRIEDLSK